MLIIQKSNVIIQAKIIVVMKHLLRNLGLQVMKPNVMHLLHFLIY